MPTVYTIGHSTRAIEEFIALLQSVKIDVLVDVRMYPGSRRHPHFSRENLALVLPRAGIEYQHRPDLGGRRRGGADSPNTFWRSASFRAYADYMDSPIFQKALDFLQALGATHRPAIMCAEAVPWQCHRQLIADALTARGVEVRHILSASSSQLHELNPGAEVRADRTLVYPGRTDPAPPQQDLFES